MMQGKDSWYTTAPYPGFGVGVYTNGLGEVTPAPDPLTAMQVKGNCSASGGFWSWRDMGYTENGKQCQQSIDHINSIGRYLTCCKDPNAQPMVQNTEPVSYQTSPETPVVPSGSPVIDTYTPPQIQPDAEQIFISQCQSKGGELKWLAPNIIVPGYDCSQYPVAKDAFGSLISCCTPKPVVYGETPTGVAPVQAEATPVVTTEEKKQSWILYGGLAVAGVAAIWYFFMRKPTAVIAQNPNRDKWQQSYFDLRDSRKIQPGTYLPGGRYDQGSRRLSRSMQMENRVLDRDESGYTPKRFGY